MGIVNKLNRELSEVKAETIFLKEKNQKKICFLETALKLQISLERKRYANAEKKWEEKLCHYQQLLDVTRVSLEKEKITNDQNYKEFHKIQELREEEKKQLTMEINELKKLHKE